MNKYTLDYETQAVWPGHLDVTGNDGHRLDIVVRRYGSRYRSHSVPSPWLTCFGSDVTWQGAANAIFRAVRTSKHASWVGKYAHVTVLEGETHERDREHEQRDRDRADTGRWTV